jgi:hypothetical protein
MITTGHKSTDRSNIMIMGDTTNTLLSPVDKSFRQKNTKEISE